MEFAIFERVENKAQAVIETSPTMMLNKAVTPRK